MIAYCPLEDVPMKPEPEVMPVRGPDRGPARGPAREETELNYVIMSFIIGVIILAVMDSTSRPT